MNLNDKYEAWKDEFDFRFIHRDKNIGEGSYIPLQEYDYDTGQAGVGDGTINMAEYIQLCLVAGQYLEAIRVVKSVSSFLIFSQSLTISRRFCIS